MSSTADHAPADGLKEWWITRSTTLPRDRLNGWVVSAMMDEFKNEGFTAKACDKLTFAQRMREAGLGDLLALEGAPRKRIKVLAKGGRNAMGLLDAGGQRAMLHTIAKSLPAYGSGIRCWAAFCDAACSRIHFPVPNRW